MATGFIEIPVPVTVREVRRGWVTLVSSDGVPAVMKAGQTVILTARTDLRPEDAGAEARLAKVREALS
jgi:hypothetical protein